MNKTLLFVALALLLASTLLAIAACGPTAAPTPTHPPSPTPPPPPPSVSSFFPADAAPPGAVVSLQGQHFGDEPGTVTFDGVAAAVLNWSETAIDVRVPLEAGGDEVRVAVTAAGQTGKAVPFTVLAPTMASLGLRDDSFYGAVAADFDLDGDLDLFVPGSVPEFGVDSAYYLNNGDGTFSQRDLAEVGLPGGTASEDAVAEDFDGDGDLDLYVVGNFEGIYALNNGDGTFTPQNLAEVGLEMRPGQVPVEKLAVVAADFDLDGDLDLFVDMGFLVSTDDFYALNNGDGTFTPRDLAEAGIPSGGDGKYCAVGDFNGDGAPDLFVGHLDAEASYLLNDGDGTFTQQDLAAAGLAGVGAGSQPVPADFDGDGDLDLFLADVEPSDNFSVEEFYALNNGDGAFVLQDLAAVGLDMPPHQFNYFVAADLNGDGASDLYGSNPFEPGGFYAQNDGDGSFALQDLTAAGLAVDAPAGLVAAGDWDGDGDLDLFLGTAYALNKGDGTFVLFR
jgi:hypothetical protein